MLKQKRIKIAALIMLLIFMISAAAGIYAPMEAMAETDEAAYISNYSMYTDGTNIYVKITTSINNRERVQRLVNTYGIDGTEYFIMNSFTDTPVMSPQNFTYIGANTFTNANEGSKSVTIDVTKQWYSGAFKEGTAAKPSKSVGSTSVTFTGSEYVGHQAYTFGSWYHNRTVYGDYMKDIKDFNNGKAYLTTLKDANTGRYKVNDGSWTSLSSGTVKKTFSFSDYKSGDTISFQTVSALGFKSEIVSYTIPSFTLTLKAQDGSSDITKTLRYNTSDYYSIPSAKPAGSGDAFLGWYTAGGTKVYNADGTVVNDGTYWKNGKYVYYGNLTLYAKYADYTLTVDPAGGTFTIPGGTSSSSGYSKSFTYGTAVNFALKGSYYSTDAKCVSQPTRTGYVFNGWKITSGSGSISEVSYSSQTNAFSFNGKSAGNVTVTAQWSPVSYTVTYDGNGATGGSTADSSHKYDETKALTANGYTRTGHTFAGWNTKKDGSGTAYADRAGVKNLTETDGATVTLYAQWKADTYTLTVDPAGGTFTIPGGTKSSAAYSKSFTYGQSTRFALVGNYYSTADECVSPPKKTGYEFTGWKITSGSGNITEVSYSSNSNAYAFDGKNNGNVTITAQWKDAVPPVFGVSDGISITPSSWTNDKAVISSTASDTGSGMSALELYTSSGKKVASGSTSVQYEQTEEGKVSYYAVATDRAGNKATSSTKTAYVDKTPPVITSGISTSSWTNGDVKITATATDALSGMKKLEIINDSGKTVATGTDSVSYTVTESTDGEYTVRAYDNAGNTSVKTHAVRVDRENPDIIIDQGDGGGTEFTPGASVHDYVIGWINHDVTVKISAKDSMSGVKGIVLKDEYGHTKETSSDTMEHTFTQEGIFRYVITVTDNAGNTTTVNLTVKIDKTPPSIYGETELDEHGELDHRAEDTLSGILSFRLYDVNKKEVTEEDGLRYDEEDDSIRFKTYGKSDYCLVWELIATDNAGNETVLTVNSPFNFAIGLEVDNLRTETEKFLIGADAMCKISLRGYVDTVEIEFQPILEAAAEKEGYSLNRLTADGNEFIRTPAADDYFEYTFKFPEGIDPDEYRIIATGYRNGYKKKSVADVNLITYEQLAKEQVHKFKRVIISSTWHYNGKTVNP